MTTQYFRIKHLNFTLKSKYKQNAKTELSPAAVRVKNLKVSTL